MNEEEIKKFLEQQGYTIKVVRAYTKSWKVVGSTSKYHFVAWQHFPLSEVDELLLKRHFPKVKGDE